jgi:peroxiredoxin
LLVAATSGATAAERTTPVPVGQPAPAVALGDQHGQPFRLADALKQRDFIVLAFYIKAFTGG